MFWTIVGALLFFFWGIPIILKLIEWVFTKEFWYFWLYILVMAILIGKFGFNLLTIVIGFFLFLLWATRLLSQEPLTKDDWIHYFKSVYYGCIGIALGLLYLIFYLYLFTFYFTIIMSIITIVLYSFDYVGNFAWLLVIITLAFALTYWTKIKKIHYYIMLYPHRIFDYLENYKLR